MTRRPGKDRVRTTRRVIARALAAIARAAVLLGVSLGASADPAAVEQPRPFGYTVGDLFEQRVWLQTPRGDFEPAALPAPARLGTWFERRDARVETAPDGRRHLVVHYQIVNAPAAVTSVKLPAWELAERGGRTLQVPAWLLTVSPLTVPVGASAAAAAPLRADRAPPLRDIAADRRRLEALLATCIASATAWAAWVAWREWRARQSLPFAQAWRGVRAPDRDEDAHWRVLHAAFDSAAGQVVRRETLARLYDRAPHLRPLADRIDAFYAGSEARFFGTPASAGGLPEAPAALCRDLRRLERAAER